ncbi:hypothetical protein [uncultured Duncaniella sp.]|uniref:hypothetical protein n=1 Tax=uncultured Duncaniella sp. TaxID=2768039 RepID=UPI0026275289|nr:hypothetical protein [uncultured Duncaniella sp.]
MDSYMQLVADSLYLLAKDGLKEEFDRQFESALQSYAKAVAPPPPISINMLPPYGYRYG